MKGSCVPKLLAFKLYETYPEQIKFVAEKPYLHSTVKILPEMLFALISNKRNVLVMLSSPSGLWAIIYN